MDTLPLQLYGITLISGPKTTAPLQALKLLSSIGFNFSLRGRMSRFDEKFPSYGILHQLEKTELAICYARK